MSTFVLIPGAGSDSWYWHRVVPLLEAAGHDAIAVDLPCDDDGASFTDYADVVVSTVRAAVGDRADLVVVAQSLGGFTAPLVCDRLDVRMLVLVAAMVPRPGESAGEWWAATGQDEARRANDRREGRDPDAPFDEEAVFLHDVPPEVLVGADGHVRPQSDRPFADPWPLAAWPAVATRFLLCRDDRFFPADFQRRVVGDRLGITPDEMVGGHLPALAHPDELVRRLLAYLPERDPSRVMGRAG